MLLAWLFISLISVNNFSLAQETLQDLEDFYNPPEGYEDAALGTILKLQEVTGDSPSYIQEVARAFQILYRSESALGEAEADVTSFFIPLDPYREQELVSYQVHEDAAALQCGPAYTLLQSDGGDNALANLLNAGVYVNVPDYEGSQSAFMTGIQAGRSILNSLKAVLQSDNNFNLSGDVPIGLWGYSGGAHAAGWAAQLQPSYAPDLNVVGTAVGGFITNLTTTFLSVNEGPNAGIIAPGILGLGDIYEDFASAAEADFKNATDLWYGFNQCSSADIDEFAGKNVFEETFNSGEAFLDIPVVKRVVDDQALGGMKMDRPMFVYQGQDDDIAPVAQVDEVVSKYCADGAVVDYWVNPGANHFVQEAAGGEYAFYWLLSRLGGVEATCTGCISTTGSVPLDYTVCPSTTSSSAASTTSVASTTGSVASTTGSAASSTSVVSTSRASLNSTAAVTTTTTTTTTTITSGVATSSVAAVSTSLAAVNASSTAVNPNTASSIVSTTGALFGNGTFTDTISVEITESCPCTESSTASSAPAEVVSSAPASVVVTSVYTTVVTSSCTDTGSSGVSPAVITTVVTTVVTSSCTDSASEVAPAPSSTTSSSASENAPVPAVASASEVSPAPASGATSLPVESSAKQLLPHAVFTATIFLLALFM